MVYLISMSIGLALVQAPAGPDPLGSQQKPGVLSQAGDASQNSTPDAAQIGQEEPSGQAPMGESPLEHIEHEMRQVQGKLAANELGTDTRQLQAGIADDLRKLIDQIQQGKACPQCGAAQCSLHSQQPRQTSMQGAQTGENQSTEGAARRTPQQVAEAELDKNLPHAQGESHWIKMVWGHLPAKLREELQQSYKESMLPGYRAKIEQYFRTIAEQSTDR